MIEHASPNDQRRTHSESDELRKTCTNIWQTDPEEIRIDSKINENRHQEAPKVYENQCLDGSLSSVRRLWHACASIF